MIIVNRSYYSGMNAYEMFVADNNDTKGIFISTDKELTEEEQVDGYSPVDISLVANGYTADINSKKGFTHKTDDGFVSTLNGYGLNIKGSIGNNLYLTDTSISIKDDKHKV